MGEGGRGTLGPKGRWRGMALPDSGPSEGRAATSPLLAAFLEKRENLVLFLAARTRSMATA